MRNLNKQKSNQFNLNVNSNQINESLPTYNNNRAFGKDITNQIRHNECVEKTLGNINEKNRIPVQNNYIAIKNNYKVQRGKIQSMDDNLLKNFLNKNGAKENTNCIKENQHAKIEKFEFNKNNKKDNYYNYIQNQSNVTNPRMEEINLTDNNYELPYKVDQISNMNIQNSQNSIFPPSNPIPIRVEKTEISLFNRNSQAGMNDYFNNNSILNNNYPVHSKHNNNLEQLRKNSLLNKTISTNNLFTLNRNPPTNQFKYLTNIEEEHNNTATASDVIMQTNSPKNKKEIILFSKERNFFPKYAQPHEEYLDDIYNTLLQEELYDTTCDYMPFQDHINPRMRIILIEWIVDVTIKFKLKQSTMFLTVHLIDRFLSLRKITRAKYQLLGACCIFIACKFEEIYFPELRDIIYICDKAYSVQEIISMESEILRGIDYKIVPVFPSRFFQIIAIQLNLSEFDVHLCNMMFELVIFDYDLVKVLPSLIACTCVYISYKIKKVSSDECIRMLERYYNAIHYGKFQENLVKECAQAICSLLDKINLTHFKRIKEKYSKKQFCEVANFYYL